MKIRWFLPFMLLILTGCTPEIRFATGVFNIVWSAQSGVAQISQWIWGVMAISLLLLGYKTYSFWFILLPGGALGAVLGLAIGNEVSAEALAPLLGVLFGFFIGWIVWSILHAITIWGVGAILGGLICFSLMEAYAGEADLAFSGIVGVFFGIFFGVIYNRLAGLLAAFLGSVILGRIFGYGGTTIYLVAGIGFLIQWQIARSRDEDVFRRPKQPSIQPTQQTKDKPKPKTQPAYSNLFTTPSEEPTYEQGLFSSKPKRFNVDDFDPNAEIQVYDD